MDIKTHLVHRATRPRLLQIERYGRKAIEIQYRQLDRVLRQGERTKFGQAVGLSRCHGLCDFQKMLPIVDYDGVKPYIERMMAGEADVLVPGLCSRFAKSSGTSNDKSKFIPVPRRHLNVCHFRGGSDALWLYLRHQRDSRFFATKGLVLGGSNAPISLQSLCRTGDLSSILIEKMPFLGRSLRVPSKEVLLMNEWESKMEAIVEEVKNARVGSLSGVPSWMLVLLKRVLERTGASTISEVWPELEVFFHGGISFEPYREQYQELIPSDRMQYVETYNASEGFFAVQDEPTEQSMLLMLDYGIFYEFIPLEEMGKEYPNVIPLEGVELGKPYAMLITSLGGLYRYLIGDVVAFTSTSPYRIRITGRTKHYINAFGEELMVDNADKALARVSRTTGIRVLEYTAAPRFFQEKGVGRHDWLIEFESNPSEEETEDFARQLDVALQELNSDYESKRYADMTLLPLHVQRASKGLFLRWMANRGKLGGQNKVPRLSNDRGWLDSLLALLAEEQR